MSMTKNYYYNITDDLTRANDIWCYIIVGGRNTGKTYSTLKYSYENKKKFVFLKRTMDDVDLLCAGSGRIGQHATEFGVDLSPFKSLNRDLGCNVKAFSIKKGLGGFWECDIEGNPIGTPIGYLLALNAVQKYKGFDLSDCSMIIFDEFIPQPWERVNKKEGEQLMDLYKTVGRDREHRGLDALKLICLANATNVSNPVMNVLEVTNKVVNMQLIKHPLYIDNERGILIHMIYDNEAFQEKEAQSSVYRAMKDTNWGRMALSNEFAYDDLSNVGRQNLKGYTCRCRFIYKHKQYFVYQKDGLLYIGKQQSTHFRKDYNLDTDNGQKLFFVEQVLYIRNKCIDERVVFQEYTIYDLVINYKKFFIV